VEDPVVPTGEREQERGMSGARVDVAGTSVSTEHYVGGHRIGSPSGFVDRSPIDWSWELAEVARGDADTAAAAVGAAEAAFPGWAALSVAERAGHLHRLADVIDANVDGIARVECLDMGMMLRSLRARVIARGAANLRNYADLAVEHEERVWSSKGTRNRVIHHPAGPAVVITPWNAPWMLATWKLAPALAAGNPVILKPAEWSPLSASLLADMAGEAGLPAGVLNVVQGFGEEVGAALVADPRVRRISFTGSPEAARSIGVAAARNIVPFTAELGGKGPLIVLDDADVDAAARKAAGQYDDAGQVCLAGTRLLVDASVEERFLEAFHRYTDEHVLGDPRDEATTVGPLIHPDHLERVHGFVERARDAGDRIVRGGRPAEVGGSGDGLWYEPTLVVPASNEQEIVQHEVFGPVLTVQTFEDESEAIALANSTPYGLSGIVYTSSRERAERVGAAVRAGTVWVNTFLVRDLTAPFGGMGISGIGREGGRYALEFHADLQTLQILEEPPS
jgi:acyl-CoA reductase-like NAD-dependent aldehyde dehydrogenase